ncbi:hypothetical protein GR925_09000 [Streptomyces sp. HUCO-GS316]|uniref:hypothetical protein n=1 Tax=Streptomyces sp. HUCO-GS316 TaxID=2692198 RepID=UPI00136E8F52|nr:hypothetical protein [Streptomyces sp. HUCO-GS316]MXM63584.1 hypothetical protein [Streptomyces sp. HUCO-GS316]
MSDSLAARSDSSPEPDFLDRLIARHTAPGAAPRSGAVRVRPRLPGPFERVEAVRARTAVPDEDAPRWPSSTPSATEPADLARPASTPEARTHTERERTVVHTERVPHEPAARAAVPVLPETPLLRPVAPLAPGPRPGSDTARRATGRGRPDQAADRIAMSAPLPPGTDTAPAADASAALRPRSADTAAARDAARQAAARRPGRAPEQVVQVQIGRLEVTAAESPAGGGRPRTPAGGRTGATLSLAAYLARGRE